jgi:hypothetical protein
MRLIPPEDAGIAEVERAPMLLTWGGDLDSGSYTGHNGEYILQLPCLYKGRQPADIPVSLSYRLGKDLGDEWTVANRGSRLEISHVPFGPYDHEFLTEVATRFLGQVVMPKLNASK